MYNLCVTFESRARVPLDCIVPCPPRLPCEAGLCLERGTLPEMMQ